MRIDTPTLQCDRCGNVTTDTTEMMKYKNLKYPHLSGVDGWDLCPECWYAFTLFIDEAL